LIKIGLTGPTGAGKSTVAAFLADRGYPCISADAAAREVTAAGSPTLALLAKTFGEDILSADGSLDRKLLAARAFADGASTAKLNAITHPAIVCIINEQAAALEKDGAKAVIIDAPLLFEAEVDKACDHTVAVIATADARRRRIIARDSLSDAAAKQRMDAQPDTRFYTDRAEVVLENNGDLSALLKQAEMLAEQIGRWCP